MRSTIAHRDFAYRPALDGIRAFAVLAVFAYHLDFSWAAGGFLGVDTFFVLSGYLITSLLVGEYGKASAIRLSAFWSRRAKRLLPAVLLLLLGVAVYAAFVAVPESLETLRGDGLATLFYVANWHFIREGASYFELWSEASPLRHMWSLAIEEQFYVIWPLVVFWALRRGSGRLRVLGLLSVVAVAISLVLMAVLYDPVDPSRAYFGTDTRMHEPLIGVLLALAMRNRVFSGRSNRVLQVAGILAAAAVLACFALVSDTGELYYRGGSLIFSLLVAIVIAAAVQTDWSPLRAGLSPAPLRWVGAVSYGLYLWHWPMIVWLNRGRTNLEGWQLDALRVAAAFAVTAASYYLLERRIRFGHIPLRRVAVAAPAAMAVVALALVGSTVGAEPSRLEIAATDLTVAPAQEPPATSTEDGSVAPSNPDPPAPTAPSSSAAAPDSGGDEAVTVASVGMVGDSVAQTMSWGLEPLANSEGLTFINNTFPGCGIAAGFMLDGEGQPFDWSQACFDSVPQVQRELIATHDPDVILWHSTWEMAAREVDGEVVKAGDPAHDEALLADIEAAHDRLTEGGATVVFLLVAPNAESDVAAADDDSDGRVAHYNSLLSEFAAEHPSTTRVVDLNDFFCPEGPPCPTEIDGVRMRPDGAHLVEETTPLFADWLYPRLMTVLGAEGQSGDQPA